MSKDDKNLEAKSKMPKGLNVLGIVGTIVFGAGTYFMIVLNLNIGRQGNGENFLANSAFPFGVFAIVCLVLSILCALSTIILPIVMKRRICKPIMIISIIAGVIINVGGMSMGTSMRGLEDNGSYYGSYHKSMMETIKSDRAKEAAEDDYFVNSFVPLLEKEAGGRAYERASSLPSAKIGGVNYHGFSYSYDLYFPNVKASDIAKEGAIVLGDTWYGQVDSYLQSSGICAENIGATSVKPNFTYVLSPSAVYVDTSQSYSEYTGTKTTVRSICYLSYVDTEHNFVRMIRVSLSN